MQVDGNGYGIPLSSNRALRFEILSRLLNKPLKVSSLNNRIRYSNVNEIEDELRLLIREEVVIARDRRFFVRNIPYVRQFIQTDRRFGT